MNLNKRTFALIAVAAFTVGVAVGSEDAPPEHQKWMKDLGSQMGALRKGVDVERNANDMQTTMKDVTEFWKKRNSEIGLKTSHETTAGAAALAKAVQSGDKEAMSAASKMIGGGCKGCHDIHREKISDTVYKIK
jgi:cytochrome c556